MTRTVALLTVLTSPALARAAHPLATDDTGTVGAAAVEVELSGAAAPVSGAGGDVRLGLGSVLHVGLSERLDLGAGIGVATVPGEGTDGVADPALDLKLRLGEAAGFLPALAVRADYKPPLAGALSTGLHDAGLVLIASWGGDRFSWHANLGGYLRDLGAGEPAASLLAGTSVVALVGDDVTVAAEVIAERAVDATTSAAGMAALQWQVADAHTISLGTGPAWVGGEVTWLATVGLTSVFEPLAP